MSDLELDRRSSKAINIVLVDHPGSGAQDEDLHRIAAALQRQDREHIATAWLLSEATVSVVAPDAVKETDWVMGMFADPDQPGALGYHSRTPTGRPLAKIFPRLDKQDGAKLSVTLSHELAEMRVDPYLTRAVQDAAGKFWALEAADAVEQDEYDIDGVSVSDFVFPEYFEPPDTLAPGTKLDQMGLIKSPFEVRPGGYMQWFGAGGWHQVVHRELAPRAYRIATGIGRKSIRVARVGAP